MVVLPASKASSAWAAFSHEPAPRAAPNNASRAPTLPGSYASAASSTSMARAGRLLEIGARHRQAAQHGHHRAQGAVGRQRALVGGALGVGVAQTLVGAADPVPQPGRPRAGGAVGTRVQAV